MATGLHLRETTEADLPFLFELQQDPVASRMAAFTAKDPADRAAFDAHWARLFANDGVRNRTIVLDGEIVGNAATFLMEGDREVTYWIAREHWGKGVATRALATLIAEEPTRPLFARAAKDNLGSIRVLEKCGFQVVGEDRGFANARGEEIEELVLKLG
jgi:RimJ/RimL family protein N-acetyltransferase